MRQNRWYGQWAFQYVINALRASGDATSYLEFLANEIEQRNSQSLPRRPTSTTDVRKTAEPGIVGFRLSFPPRALADFPTEILYALHPPANHDPFGSGAVVAGLGEGFVEDDVLAQLPKLKNPVLRVLIASRFETDEAEAIVEQSLTTMLDADSPQLDAYLLAAGRATENGIGQEAVNYLQKARYLPMTRGLRKQIDAALTATVLELVEGNERSEALLQAGRDAALRLRRNKLNAGERNELIAALEDLGLEKEADQLDQIAASSAGSGFVAAPALCESRSNEGSARSGGQTSRRWQKRSGCPIAGRRSHGTGATNSRPPQCAQALSATVRLDPQSHRIP